MLSKVESSFREGRYRGYEVGLKVVRKNRDYEPYPINNASDVFNFMRELGNESAEYMYELLLDGRRRIVGVYLVGKGGCGGTYVHYMEIYKAAFMTNSPAFILVHNHPSGITKPNEEDIIVSKKIALGAETVGLQLVDSLIIGEDNYYSMLDAGMIEDDQSYKHPRRCDSAD